MPMLLLILVMFYLQGGNTPFMLAAEKNKHKVLQILASHDMNEINAQNSVCDEYPRLFISLQQLHSFDAKGMSRQIFQDRLDHSLLCEDLPVE